MMKKKKQVKDKAKLLAFKKGKFGFLEYCDPVTGEGCGLRNEVLPLSY